MGHLKNRFSEDFLPKSIFEQNRVMEKQCFFVKCCYTTKTVHFPCIVKFKIHHKIPH